MESTMNRAIFILGRNMLLSMVVLAIMTNLLGLKSYFATGVFVATILTFKKLPHFLKLIKLPLFDKVNSPVFYAIVFFMDVVMWPTAVIAQIATAYLKEQK